VHSSNNRGRDSKDLFLLHDYILPLGYESKEMITTSELTIIKKSVLLLRKKFLIQAVENQNLSVLALKGQDKAIGQPQMGEPWYV
jgi:hypothetical protein